MTVPGCPPLLGPLCQAAAGVGTTVAGVGVDDVFGALSGWVVDGATWLLDQIGGVLSSSTAIDLGAGWFTDHYRAMTAIAAVVVLPMLLLSTIQAIYRQSATVLLRSVLVQLPLALLLTAVAIQLVRMSLAVTDALCGAIAAGSGADLQQALSGVATTLAGQITAGPQGAPSFVLLLGALLVALGALALWLEMLVRSAAVYVAVLFLPIGLASLVWPAVSHWARRLVDTLVSLILSKFVIVAVLALAVSALGSGTQDGFSAVLGGGALLLLAAFSPFVLLRLVPAVELGAAHHLEGVRHRLQSTVGPIPRGAAAHALREMRASSFVPGLPGTGQSVDYIAPGSGSGSGSGSGGGGGGGGSGGGASGGGRSGGRGPGLTAGSTAAGSHGRRGSGAGPAGGGSQSVVPAGEGRGAPTGDDLGGIPMWKGLPFDEEGPDGSAGGDGAPPRQFGTGGVLPGHGPLPLWGGPLGTSADGEREPAIDDDAGGTGAGAGTGGRLQVGRDAIGPVLRWTPPPSRSSGTGGEGGPLAEGGGPGGRPPGSGGEGSGRGS